MVWCRGIGARHSEVRLDVAVSSSQYVDIASDELGETTIVDVNFKMVSLVSHNKIKLRLHHQKPG